MKLLQLYKEHFFLGRVPIQSLLAEQDPAYYIKLSAVLLHALIE
jgi:hypothetical protein